MAALLASIIEAFILLKIGCATGFAASQIKFGSFLFAGMIVLALVKNSGDKIRTRFFDRLLISIGDCSYGIFYVHMLVLMVIQKLVSVAELSEVWLVNFLLCFVLTATGSYLIVCGVKRLAEKLDCQKVLDILGF